MSGRPSGYRQFYDASILVRPESGKDSVPDPKIGVIHMLALGGFGQTQSKAAGIHRES